MTASLLAPMVVDRPISGSSPVSSGHDVAMRVAYTLEQCWHDVPGGTAVAALRVAEAMEVHDDVRLIGVAGRHKHLPDDPWIPSIPIAHLPLGAPWLYQTWLRFGWPNVERATGRVDVAHATGLVPCPTTAPLVVTLHDLAFMHTPEHFSRLGNSVFRASLDIIRRDAAVVLCSSQATLDDVSFAGIESDRLRLVPLGVDIEPATPEDVARVRRLYELPERYLLFVGTVEPRKNLRGLVAAVAMLDDPLPLVVAGSEGWGDIGLDQAAAATVRFLGFVPSDDLSSLYAGADVFCYPSEREGYGLPVLEAMAQGVPVVTSAGTATEETAGGAAVLVKPTDPADIARGIDEAIHRRAELSAKGVGRAHKRSWSRTAALTAAVYRELVS
jgi:glycosyltransferase involved in cell wall biosynthesis